MAAPQQLLIASNSSPLLTGLIFYGKLDEAAAANAIDSHGTNTLTDNNGCGTGTGKINGARTFNGTTQFLSRATNASLETGDIDFTIAGWFNPNSCAGFPGLIARLKDATNYEYVLGAWDGSPNANKPYFQVSPDGTAASVATVVSNTAFPMDGSFSCVIAWHDATANEICIQFNNGTVVATPHTTGVFVGVSDFYIGGREGPVTPALFNGLIDEVAFAKRVWTSGERTSFYNAGAGLAYPF